MILAGTRFNPGKVLTAAHVFDVEEVLKGPVEINLCHRKQAMTPDNGSPSVLDGRGQSIAEAGGAGTDFTGDNWYIFNRAVPGALDMAKTAVGAVIIRTGHGKNDGKLGMAMQDCPVCSVVEYLTVGNKLAGSGDP